MSQTGFRTGFVDVLTAAGNALPPTSLSGGGLTGVDAPLAGFLRGFAGVQRQRQQSQQMAQQAEVARARGEFTQSQTLLNLAKVGEQGAVGRGLLSAFFKGNIPAPIEAAFKENQGMELSIIEQNDSIVQTFISPLADRGMLGETPEENERAVQHMRGIIRSLKPNQAATFAQRFHEASVAGKTIFGMTELSPFVEEAITNREDDLARDGNSLRRQTAAANRRTAGELMTTTTRGRLPQLANRPVVSISDAELSAMSRLPRQTVDAIRQSRDAAIQEVKSLRKQERAVSRERLTLRRPDWPPTISEFDNTYHGDDLTEGIAAALIKEVKQSGRANDLESLVREVQSLAHDRFWDSASEEHIVEVMKLDPTLRHLVEPDLSALEIPGVGIMTKDDLDFFAKEQGITPEVLRQRLINRGATPTP